MTATRPLSVDIMRTGVPVHDGSILTPPAGSGPLKCGPNTELQADGRTMLATTSGIAHFEPDQVTVYPADIIIGDIYPAIKVSVFGNLIISGRLQPGAVVRVGGSVLIRGEVEGAEIEALGAVLLQKGCANSQVQAGTTRHGYVQLVGRVDALATSFGQLLAVIESLRQSPSFRSVDLTANLGPLLRVLFERKFPTFPSQMALAITQLEGYRHYGGPVAELVELLKSCFSPENLLKATHSDVRSAYAKAKAVVETFSATGGHRQDIIIENGAMNAALQASGSVRVNRGEVRLSSVKAESGIRVAGTVTGGALVASEWIEVGEVTGGCSLEITGGGWIQAGLIDAGTQVLIGSTSTQVTSRASSQRVALVGGQLKFEPRQEVTQNVS